MFFRSLQQVAEDDIISRGTRATAYLQLCYANIDSFGAVQDFGEALRCLKAAAKLGSPVAAAILRPLILATGQMLDRSLENDLKHWLAEGIKAGSISARNELRLLDEDLSALKKAEEGLKLFMGAKSATPSGVADADLIETFFLPANLAVMKMLLGPVQDPILASLGAMGMCMSRSMNTYLHAGAALGVDSNHFRNVISVADIRNINAQDDAGNTPLHLAMRFGNVEIAQILLKHGAKPSLPNKRGETPWHWLISLEESDMEEVTRLMSEDTEGLGIFSRPRHSTNDQYAITHGGTPLHWAVDMRALGMALELLGLGADPLLEYGGLSPVDAAIKHNAAELLYVFLDHIADNGEEFLPQRTLFDLSIVGDTNHEIPINVDLGPVDTLLLQASCIRPLHERLIYNGVDWLSDMSETLRLLQKNGNLEPWSKENNEARIEVLRLSSFADSSWTKLVEAMLDVEIFPGHSVGNNETVDNDIVVTFWKQALNGMLPSGQVVAILFAIEKIREHSSSSRLDDAEDILSSYCSSLNADITVVESILKDCAEVDCVDGEGRTPLMKAVRERHFEIATYLLGRGADVSRAWTHEGQPVYMLYEYVVNNTDIDVVPIKYLLEPLHPFPDKIPPFFNGPTHEDTILHQACKDENPVIVDYLLLKFGSKDHLDQPGSGGFTALHHAVFNGHAELVMKLCRAGANVNVRSGTPDMPNRKRSRPLDLCFRWWTQSTDFLSHKYGLERTREDILLARLRIAEHLIRRHQARRANRFLVHRSLALKYALGAAEDGMTNLLAVALRQAKEEMDMNSHQDVDYSLMLSNLLWVAALRGHVSATRLLLTLGANTEQKSAKGLSLMHLVCWLGKAEVVYVLAKNGGADVNVEDANGETPASYSVKSKDLATIRMVKSMGGQHTLPRERMTEIMRNVGIDPSILPPSFNPRFIVRFAGEPSDDELSDRGDRSEDSDIERDNGGEGSSG
jgi:ankyrin repeat protein